MAKLQNQDLKFKFLPKNAKFHLKIQQNQLKTQNFAKSLEIFS